MNAKLIWLYIPLDFQRRAQVEAAWEEKGSALRHLAGSLGQEPNTCAFYDTYASET